VSGLSVIRRDRVNGETMFGMGPMELLIVAIMFVVVVLPFWKIFEKAGFPPALALTQLVPLVNLAVLFYLAFADWPALRQDQT
jgi:hypothetical protein